MPLQIRRGTTAEREAITPLAGELVFDTTLGAVYIGDGSTAGGLGVTAFTTEQAQDAVAALVSAGTHTGITFTYNDVLGTLSATVEGAARLDINGSVYGDDSSPLVDAVLNSFQLDGTIRSHVVPYADSVYDLGSSSNKFRDLYLSGSSLYLGDAVLTSTGTAVNLPAGSTVAGVPIGVGSGDGVVEGSNYNINIIGDDSGIIVNSATGVITGDTFGYHTGDVEGTVYAGDAIFASTGITTSNPTLPFYMGDATTPIDLQMYLRENLTMRSDEARFLTTIIGRGTFGSPEAVQADDDLGGFLVRGYTDSSTTGIVGLIGFSVDSTAVIAGGDFIKSRVIISAATDTSQDAEDAFVLDGNGCATSNSFTASKYFQLPVFADDTARGTAIPTPLKGMMIFIESGITPAATNQMQVFDGTNWVNAS